jgi:hypothetical protein
VRSEGLCRGTPSGIEPATYQLVVQYLIQSYFTWRFFRWNVPIGVPSCHVRYDCNAVLYVTENTMCIFMYIRVPCIFIVYYLFVPTNAQIYLYIRILNYITKAPTCFGAFAPSSGSFDIVFAKVTKY